MAEKTKKLAISTLKGIAFLIGGFWFGYQFTGNPFDDLILILKGEIAQGFVVNGWEDAGEDDRGHAKSSYGVTYKFRLPDGREFSHDVKGSGQLNSDFSDFSQPIPVEIEYLPSDPSVSRLKGDGSPNLFDWLWRKLGLSIVIFVQLLFPGALTLRNAFREYHDYPTWPRE
jgi:hypothetical protein